MKKIAILIINFNGLVQTLTCLQSLEKIKHEQFTVQIFVVDYGLEDQTQEIKAKFPDIQIYREEKNLGFAGGNNFLGTKALAWQADYILLLNNDTLVSPDFLQKLFNYLEKNPKVAAVCPKIYFAKGYEYHKNKYQDKDLGKVIWYAGGKIDWDNIYSSHRGVDEVDYGQFNETNDTQFFSGCCVLLRTEVVQKIGLFNEKLFMYWEDVDLSMRILKSGFAIKYYPQSYIFHKNAGSSGVGSSLHDYFLNRNRLYFAFKYASLRTKLAIFRQSLVKLVNGSQWERQAVKDFYLGNMGIGSWK
ncbi:glycosyltransferase family 2 protein [Candidatus Beckwithbacteria bacterium]|nr:glycosyltransferase family 2 protein [Candidatus Beckwithbacteria bacterium]